MKPLLRHPANPILQASNLPYPATLVFNAGVVKYEGRYVMLFRNDFGCTAEDWQAFREGRTTKAPAFDTTLGVAFSADGVKWEVAARPSWKLNNQEIRRVYDPRLTLIDGRPHVCFAMDTAHGIRGGVARTDDFFEFEILSLSVPDNRNMVLFPEKINGRYFRLERPFPVYSRGGKDRFDIWGGWSPDLRYWGDHSLVLGTESVPFANAKIGPAAPPIRTARGWLTTFHSVWADDRNRGGWQARWLKRYDAGLMLLDLDDPARVIGLAREPLLTPEAPYEMNGFRNEVIFPGGMILEDSGEVKIYYGAADTFVALATAHVEDLLALCQPV